MRYKPKWSDPKALHFGSGGDPGDVDCPLRGGEEIPFEECLQCEFHDIDFYGSCAIKEEEHRESLRREQEEIDRQAEEWRAKREEEDRKTREEMADWRRDMEKDSKKWQKQYERDGEEYEKLEEERKENFRESLVRLYGEESVAASERFIESMGKEDEDEGDEGEDEEDEDEY